MVASGRAARAVDCEMPSAPGAVTVLAAGEATRNPLFREAGLAGREPRKGRLPVAVLRGLSATVDVLVDDGPATAFSGVALRIAARGGRADVVELLLAGAGGGVVESRDAQGCTALHLAAAARSPAAVDALLRHGADPNARDLRGQTPAHKAAAPSPRGPRARRWSASVLRKLQRADADLRVEDNRGHTPMETAVLSGNRGAVVQLDVWV